MNSIGNFSSDSLRRARFATGAMFFINGGIVATWASRIPAIQEHLHLGTGPLGIALLSMAVGALASMALSGALATHFGSRPVVSYTMIASCIVSVLPAFAVSLPLLAASVALMGAFLGAMDVAMNAHAVALEKLLARPIMSSSHALFSIGAAGFAFVGSGMAWLRIDPQIHFSFCAAVVLILGVVSTSMLLPANVDATEGKFELSMHVENTRCLLGSAILIAAAISMFCCFLVEGAMGDWSAVYLRTTMHTDPGFAVLGFASFAVTMCIGRMIGDAAISKLGALPVLRFGSGIALVGLLLVVGLNVPLVAVLGFGLIGLGVSNIVPIAFSCAGKAPNAPPGTAIAAVSLMGYLGLLCGPPIIGFAAESITLRSALALLAALLISIILLSSKLAESQHATTQSQKEPCA